MSRLTKQAISMNQLQEKIIACQKCSRLREWCQSRAGEKASYRQEKYWGLPVPGFGDRNGRLLIVGLAPGAHGANRTGRPFTGDDAGIYLYRALYEHGFSNQPKAISRFDDLKLSDAYITNAVRCAPPGNIPTPEEFKTCISYLRQELDLLSQVKVILTLGEKAFKSTKTIVKEIGADVKEMVFKHGAVYDLGNKFPVVVASYHTSRYNMNTGVITVEMLDDIFRKIKEIIKMD